jgi:serine/threonine protein kinase
MQPGDRIGRYKLLEPLGEGGCGVVFLAEQQEPVRRRVALKVIKPGMDTRQVVARFEAERQALALMDHPNIAKVLDGGATETGRPYFVMELVKGIKITDYCDQNNLSPAQRLELFIQVCRAVGHAHQQGIIHRDIKPSNVLIALQNAVAAAKVIDFGIAKATTGQLLTDNTLFTALEQFLGTPAYMSPEQAELSPDRSADIDVRSDVYSLGVLLYELLTGRTPFDTKELVASGLHGMRRTIQEREPDRPSTCLGRMVAADLATTARQRQSEPPQLIHLLRGDLDWIVMKALEKDRTRRYATAEDLASDVERHLSEQAVVARPPSPWYRLNKWVRHHRRALRPLAAVVGVVLFFLGVCGYLLIRQQAAQRRIDAVRVAGKSYPLEARLKQLNNLAAESRQAGRFAEAELQFRDVLALQQRLRAKPGLELANTLDGLAGVLQTEGEHAKAELAYREELAVLQGMSTRDPSRIAGTLSNLVEVVRQQGKAEEVRRLVGSVTNQSSK